MKRPTRFAGVLAVWSALAVAAGCAGTPTGPSATSASLVPADGEWIRCVDEPLTGSRIPQRKCLTEDQWQRLEEASKQGARDMQGPIYGPRDVAGAGTPPL